jgi:hypothetical protein
MADRLPEGGRYSIPGGWNVKSYFVFRIPISARAWVARDEFWRFSLASCA